MAEKAKSMKMIEIDLFSAIVALFFIFWMMGGWYRIDCALGTAKACALIAAEYDAKAKP